MTAASAQFIDSRWTRREISLKHLKHYKHFKAFDHFDSLLLFWTRTRHHSEENDEIWRWPLFQRKLTAVDESVNKLSRVVISVRPLYCLRLQEPGIWPTISFVQIHSSVWQMQLPWCPPCVWAMTRLSVLQQPFNLDLHITTLISKLRLYSKNDQ